MTTFQVEIIFFYDLNDFLPHLKRGNPIRLEQRSPRSIKDLIESLGIPHTEVGQVKTDGRPVDISEVIREQVRIEVYPFSITDLRSQDRLNEKVIRFVGDVHLGSLVRKLRLLGLDTEYSNRWTDLELASISAKENRFLLTRDRRLLMRRIVRQGIFVRSEDPGKQVSEVVNRLGLKGSCKPFTRCLVCNGILIPVNVHQVSASQIREKIPQGVWAWCRQYSICQVCGNIYWPGSHFKKLRLLVDTYLA
jgi:uncharacterized protein with PIN domain